MCVFAELAFCFFTHACAPVFLSFSLFFFYPCFHHHFLLTLWLTFSLVFFFFVVYFIAGSLFVFVVPRCAAGPPLFTAVMDLPSCALLFFFFAFSFFFFTPLCLYISPYPYKGKEGEQQQQTDSTKTTIKLRVAVVTAF